MEFLKWLFCKHPHIYWVRNIYGDEINLNGGKRSLWHCPDCKMWEPRRDLHPEPNTVTRWDESDPGFHFGVTDDKRGLCR